MCAIKGVIVTLMIMAAIDYTQVCIDISMEQIHAIRDGCAYVGNSTTLCVISDKKLPSDQCYADLVVIEKSKTVRYSGTARWLLCEYTSVYRGIITTTNRQVVNISDAKQVRCLYDQQITGIK